MSGTDDMAYVDAQRKNLIEYEDLCRQCGKCCGVDTDPCANLKKGAAGRYYCAVYANRLGSQSTVSGRVFTCVEIREVKNVGMIHEGCGYGR
jgi:hypothetical protein